MVAILPLDEARDFMCLAAPSTSPTRRASGTPPWARPPPQHRPGLPLSVTTVQVGHEGDVPFVGEAPGDFLGTPVVAGHVVDDDDSAVRPGPGGLREVGLDLVTAVGSDRDRLSFHVEGHAAETI